MLTVTFHPLFCHPASLASDSLAVFAAVQRTTDGLDLRYRLVGPPASLLLPSPQPAEARDGLWQQTCCELFVAAVDGPFYQEFNFSPSSCWAAYRFSGYRQRDIAWQAWVAPPVCGEWTADAYQLTAQVPAELLPTGPLRLGLTVVLESADRQKTFWALQHDAAQPDFHLSSSFVLRLP